MQIVYYSVAAMVGAVFGSFLNVVAIRTHENSTLLGRSHCMNCKKTLKPKHLVPILSWVLQKGRCTDCGARIHYQYPLVEALMALFAVIAVARHGFDGAWMSVGFEFFFFASLLVFVVMDLRWMELPLEMMVGTGIVLSLWRMLLEVFYGQAVFAVLWEHAIGFGVLTLFFLFQWFVSRKRWIGSGDIWLAGALGAVLGWPLGGLTVYFAYVLGGLVATALLLARKIKAGARIPFAPALAAGAVLALWFGPIILEWLGHAISPV